MSAELPLMGLNALVTGGARGLGRAIAVGLAEAGSDVAVADLHLAPFRGERYYRLKKRHSGAEEETSTAQAVEAVGRRACAVECDVADPESVRRAVERVLEDFGQIDVLVNNAGIVNNIASIAEMEPEAWAHEISVNLSGGFHFVQALAPAMSERGFGRVINISSVAARTPIRGQAAYSASKAGVIAFTQAVAQEFGPSGVTANAVLPGLIATPLVLSMPGALREAAVRQTPVRRIGQPAEVASLVAYLASPAAGFINAAAIPCDGGGLGAPGQGLDV